MTKILTSRTQADRAVGDILPVNGVGFKLLANDVFEEIHNEIFLTTDKDLSTQFEVCNFHGGGTRLTRLPNDETTPLTVYVSAGTTLRVQAPAVAGVITGANLGNDYQIVGGTTGQRVTFETNDGGTTWYVSGAGGTTTPLTDTPADDSSTALSAKAGKALADKDAELQTAIDVLKAFGKNLGGASTFAGLSTLAPVDVDDRDTAFLTQDDIGTGTTESPQYPKGIYSYSTTSSSFSLAIRLSDESLGVMTGATATTAGAEGLVPAPAKGDEVKTILGDGTWGIPDTSGTHYTAEDTVDALSMDGMPTNGSFTGDALKNGPGGLSVTEGSYEKKGNFYEFTFYRSGANYVIKGERWQITSVSPTMTSWQRLSDPIFQYETYADATGNFPANSKVIFGGGNGIFYRKGTGEKAFPSNGVENDDWGRSDGVSSYHSYEFGAGITYDVTTLNLIESQNVFYHSVTGVDADLKLKLVTSFGKKVFVDGKEATPDAQGNLTIADVISARVYQTFTNQSATSGTTYIETKKSVPEAQLEENEAYAITGDGEALIFEGMEFRMSQAARQGQMRATTGNISIEGVHYLQHGGTSEADLGLYTVTLNQTWVNFDKTGETLTTSGAQETLVFKRTDTGQWYEAKMVIGYNWINNIITIRKLGQKTYVPSGLLLASDRTISLAGGLNTISGTATATVLEGIATALVLDLSAGQQIDTATIDQGTINIIDPVNGLVVVVANANDATITITEKTAATFTSEQLVKTKAYGKASPFALTGAFQEIDLGVDLTGAYIEFDFRPTNDTHGATQGINVPLINLGIDAGGLIHWYDNGYIRIRIDDEAARIAGKIKLLHVNLGFEIVEIRVYKDAANGFVIPSATVSKAEIDVTVNGANATKVLEGAGAHTLLVTIPASQMIDVGNVTFPSGVTGVVMDAEYGRIAVEIADGTGNVDITVPFIASPASPPNTKIAIQLENTGLTDARGVLPTHHPETGKSFVQLKMRFGDRRNTHQDNRRVDTVITKAEIEAASNQNNGWYLLTRNLTMPDATIYTLRAYFYSGGFAPFAATEPEMIGLSLQDTHGGAGNTHGRIWNLVAEYEA